MKICYFGIYKPDLSRNKIYMSGLRKSGVEVLECRDDGGKISKYINLWKKHHKIRNEYDVMIVGYPGHVIVPFAKIISKKPVIADLLGSFKDAEEHSHRAGFLRRMKDGFIDYMAVKFSDAILLESEAQKRFFEDKYGKNKKFKVVYTGLDESIFHCVKTGSERFGITNRKIVLFRGRLTPESGTFHILKTAELLRSRKDILFRVIGFHYLLGEEVKKTIKERNLYNVELIYEYLPDDILREKMCEASVALGQFESNPRLNRTIPHKIFEAMRMNIPLVTGYSPAVGEFLEDGRDCLFVRRADPEDLMNKITTLMDDRVLANRLAENAAIVYRNKISTDILVRQLIIIIKELL